VLEKETRGFLASAQTAEKNGGILTIVVAEKGYADKLRMLFDGNDNIRVEFVAPK
jgi:hypothetical protein